jgi:hypothetical protein
MAGLPLACVQAVASVKSPLSLVLVQKLPGGLHPLLPNIIKGWAGRPLPARPWSEPEVVGIPAESRLSPRRRLKANPTGSKRAPASGEP